jgi:hypothetical protein
MARGVQVSGRRLFRELGDSALSLRDPPLLGTRFMQTPEISAARSIVHFVLCVTCFYLGFIRQWKGRPPRMT